MHGPLNVKLKLHVHISTAFAVTLLDGNFIIGSETV
jgi:hypothetical protein